MEPAPKETLRQRLLERYSLRLHVSLLLAATVAVGLLCSKLLFWLGVHSMLWRYPLTLLVAYLAFFAFVRLWLKQVGCLREHAKPRDSGIDLSLADGWSGSGSSGASAPSLGGRIGSGGGLKGGGGQFGGGGASASFADESPAPVPALAVSQGSARSGGAGSKIFGDIDFDVGDAWPLVLAIVVLVLIVGGAFAYMLYAGPTVLIDAAFEATLAGGLVRAGKNTARGDWIGSIWRATWIPFSLVMLAAIGFAWAAAVYAPGAHTFGQAIAQLLTHG